jgi:hypothetical protein
MVGLATREAVYRCPGYAGLVGRRVREKVGFNLDRLSISVRIETITVEIVSKADFQLSTFLHPLLEVSSLPLSAAEGTGGHRESAIRVRYAGARGHS